jgi:phosphoenolpyruvate synthase/pyruvate phosphate dikinase
MKKASWSLYILQFFASDERIKAVRQMIMAPTVELRQKALDRLLPYQRSDFEGIFRAMDGMWNFLYIFLYCFV